MDLTTSPPVATDWVNIGMSAEDITLSPDGRWALITNGRDPRMPNDQIATLDVLNHRLANILNPGLGAKAIAIAPQGRLVLVVDTESDQVHALHLNPVNGELTTLGQARSTGKRPINVAFSPDGRTALVANFWDDSVTVFRIDGQTDVVRIGELRGLPGGQQSIAFSPDGHIAYVISTIPDPDQLSVLDIKGPGEVTDSHIRIELSSRAQCGFYGVDPIAFSPKGDKAYIGNPCDDYPVDKVTVIDRASHRVAKQISVGHYPTGIDFYVQPGLLSDTMDSLSYSSP